MSHNAYRLRCQLYGHEADVRSVSTITEYDGLVSGSRDRTARLWRPIDRNSFEQRAVLKNHTNFVIATCYIPPSDAFTDGLIATGGNDKTICVYSAKQGVHLFTLEGHEATVSCLSYVSQTDLLLSTSWDCTARVWSLTNQNCTQTLKGHTKAVWGVISMIDTTTGSNLILTGAADNLIFAWKNQSNVRTFQGHTGCVRSLAVLNSNEFLSSANDNTIKRWQLNSGRCLQTFEGHTNFVYSVSVISPEFFASISEDRSLRLWSIESSGSMQTIRLPSATIWSVCALNNGDVAVGCSDGRICVFTKDPSRVANAAEISAFEEELASSSIQTKTGDMGEVKIDDLPNEDALKKPGVRDGQTTMINKGGGQVEAYQWDMADQRWMKIGDVVGSADSTAGGQASAAGEKICYEGKYYDYVFNVELDDHRPLKLPYNLNEDPWFAAQAFIHRNELSQTFLDQIAQFIMSNTKGMLIDQTASDYVDPFTGGGRYVPSGGSSKNEAEQSAGVDPFTAAGRYIPVGSSAAPKTNTTSVQDPFTGAGRYVPNGGAEPTLRPLSASQSTVLRAEKDADLTSTFPQAHYVTMVNADIGKILAKLKEFNSNVTGDGARLSDSQFQEITEFINGNTNELGAKINVLFQLLNWPIDKIFPVLDVIRLLMLNGEVCKYLLENDGKANEFFSRFLSYLQAEQSANTMLVCRTFTNLFSNDFGEKYLIRHSRSILPRTLICLPSSKKNTQIALINVILNYCIYSYRNNDQDLSSYLYDCYRDFVDVQLESDGAKRLLLGLGTLFHTNADLVLNFQTTSDNSAKRFFTALEKSATQFSGDTLECFERCRTLVKNL